MLTMINNKDIEEIGRIINFRNFYVLSGISGATFP